MIPAFLVGRWIVALPRGDRDRLQRPLPEPESGRVAGFAVDWRGIVVTLVSTLASSPRGQDTVRAPGGTLVFADGVWQVSRPKPFVLVIEGRRAPDGGLLAPGDYLHEVLLAPAWRAAFFDLVDATGLVCCLGLETQHPTYRDVRGRSSRGRLSPGEYFHHDGCSGPQKPRVVEIRCPYQDHERGVATSVAPFHAVVPAMIAALPPEFADSAPLAGCARRLEATAWPDDDELEDIQGIITRSVRCMRAETARAYFRTVDRLADAYFLPWGRGESRLIANAGAGATMQHRRAYQDIHRGGVATGRLVKRWPAEELVDGGDAVVDPRLLALACRDEDERCERGPPERLRAESVTARH